MLMQFVEFFCAHRFLPHSSSSSKGGIGGSANRASRRSFAHYFDDHSLLSLSVELGVENPLPGAEIEPPRCDGHDHFMVNQESFEMRIAIVLAGLVMFVISLERRQML